MSSVEEDQYSSGHIERKTRRAMAIRNLWKSTDEITQAIPARTANSNLTQSLSIDLRDANISSFRHEVVDAQLAGESISPIQLRHPQQRTLDIRSLQEQDGHSYLTSLIGPDAQTVDTSHRVQNSISKTRLCQSLLLPIVLGLLIFLAAICSHQVSLTAISYDALVMIIALTIILIIMSSLAIWASYDDAHDHSETNATTNVDGQHSRDYFDESILHNCIDAFIFDRHHMRTNNVAVIDCKPPDYYNALRNSKPVTKTLVTTSQTGVSHLDEANISPPKYNDVADLF